MAGLASDVDADSILGRRFEAAIFDWDGTAVPDRSASALRVRRLVEALSAAGFDLGIVSGTHVDNVDGQLAARPTGPGRLLLALNRGSEVFEVGPSGPCLLERRTATEAEERQLTAAAERTAAALAERGLRAEIVAERLNRRKIDLIPEPDWADPPKARIGELVEAVQARLARAGIDGLPAVVELAREQAAAAGLADPRVTSDAKHVEIGLTDKSDSAAWLLGDLWRRGVSSGGVLVAGDELGPLGGVPGSDSLMLRPRSASRATVVSVGVEPLGVPPGVRHLGGGPSVFADMLDEQLRLRRSSGLPELDEDPAWTLIVEGADPELERVRETLLTLGDGRFGTRGSAIAPHSASAPRVLAAGVYDGDGEHEELLACPLWTRLSGAAPATFRRLRHALDLRAGMLRQELPVGDGRAVRAVLFSSLARPGTVVLRAEGPPARLDAESPLEPAAGSEPSGSGALGAHRYLAVSGTGGTVAAAATETRVECRRDRVRLDRIGVFRVDPACPDELATELQRVDDAGFDRLLVEHRAAWAGRWEDADVQIDGDPQLQLAVRHALFHLMGAVATDGEAALGARGLSGPGYRGHVFWDADVFVLPFLAATCPPAARAMLEYRVRRLEAARQAARALGRAGARFPWESARTGLDVTPRSAPDQSGNPVPILTGELEEHIVADVAWAAATYADWTGDEAFRRGAGLELLVETARYWTSRARRDGDGRAHIDEVIGPDEYHERVDDNAYTNVMARWNLRRAAEDAAGLREVDEQERRGWLDLAEALVDGYDADSGVYEQFAGFFALEPLLVVDVAPRRPVDAVALLGADRVRTSQVVKQADVLMLHHVVPDEVEPGSLEANLEFYEPRTAHGSSLSPGVHAALLARAGRLDDALRYLRLASRIDLDDLTGTTAGGLHAAAAGSIWQALALGLTGLRPRAGQLVLDPRLPADWRALELRIRFRGSRVRIRVEPATVKVTADPAIPVSLAGAAPLEATPAGVSIEHDTKGAGR